jgi:DNA-binding transcriptional LysR family regulator
MTANLQDVDWDDVRVFLALVRARSLGRGAARLGIDTSTASRRLAALEERLGARLFERSREGLVPTRAAERVQAAAELMESAHGRFARDASGVETQAEGVVRLSAAPGLAQDFVAPALPRLRARHPRLRLELDASTRTLDLTRHEADLALRSVPLEGAALVATRLGRSRWVAAASPLRVKAVGRVRDWEALPWIGWDGDMVSFHAARWLSRHAPHAEVVLRTSHFAAQLAAARAGLGVVLAPEQHLRVYRLAPVPFVPALQASAAAWPEDDLWLVGHKVLRDVPRVAAVWQFLVDELRVGRRGTR